MTQLNNDLLYDTAKHYKQLSKQDYIITYDGDKSIKVRFFPRAYHHIIGLHKFTDIAEVTINKSVGRTAISIYNSILRKEITIYDLQRSCHYDYYAVSDRLSAFLQIEKIFTTNSKVVPDYHPGKLQFDSKINATTMMYCISWEVATSCTYMYLFLAKDSNTECYYPVSFFENSSNRYLYGQTVLPIMSVTNSTFK